MKTAPLLKARALALMMTAAVLGIGPAWSQARDEALLSATTAEQPAVLKTLERLVNIETGTGDEDHLQGIFQLAHEWMVEAGKDSTWVSMDHPDHGYPFLYRNADGSFKPDPVQEKAFETFMAYFDERLKK